MQTLVPPATENITLNGTGGTTAEDHGVVIGSGSVVTSTKTAGGAGTITITGHGQSGNGTDGIRIVGAGTTISSHGGAVQITGSSDSDEGIVIANGSLVQSLGTGVNAATITVDGTSGPTNDSIGVTIGNLAEIKSEDGDILVEGTGTDGLRGIYMFVGGKVTSTGTTTNAAGITITGTGGSNDSIAVDGTTGTRISSVDGNITITGTANPDGLHGVNLYNGATVEVTAGLLQVTGSGGDGGTGSQWPGVSPEDASVTSIGDGAITLTSAMGEIRAGSGSVIGGSSMTGAITLIADTITLNAGSVGGTIESEGALIIKPLTTSTPIGIGGGAGALRLEDSELSTLVAGFDSITIGDITSGTGAVDIETATFADPVTIAGGTIKDNAGTDVTAPSVTLDGNVSPGQSPGILSVSESAEFADNHTFDIEIGGATAGTGAGFHDQISATGSVTIGSNVTLATTSFGGFVPITGQQLEIISRTGGSGEFAGLPEGATVSNDFLGSGLTATITYTGGDGDDVILDIVDPPQVTVEDVTAVEGTGLVFTVTLDKAVQGAFDVDISLADVTATGGVGEDYDNATQTINFTGTAGETQQFTITTNDDAVMEGTETFMVSLDASNAFVVDSDTATGTITDNDDAQVTVEDVTAVEGTGLVFTVTLDKAVQGAFDVDVSLADVTATGGVGEDYDNATQTINFTGTAGETQQFTITTNDDAVLEGTETFTVSLDASNALVVDSDTATGTITDNDSDGSPQLYRFVVATSSSQAALFTVEDTNITPETLSVSPTTDLAILSDGTVLGDSYRLDQSSSGGYIEHVNYPTKVDVRSETGSLVQTVTTTITDPFYARDLAAVDGGGFVLLRTNSNDNKDDLFSYDASGNLIASSLNVSGTLSSITSLADGSLAALNSPALGTTWIRTYDTITLAQTGSFDFTNVPSNLAEYDIAGLSNGGLALLGNLAGEDYVYVWDSPLDFSPVGIKLSDYGINASGLKIGGDLFRAFSASVSISGTTNGDEAGPVNGVFTVTQTVEAAADTVLTYSVDGTSTSGDDYTALSGTVTIPAGSTSTTITVSVIDDAIAEGTETLELTLTAITSSSAGVTIDGGAKTDSIDIADNDPETGSISGVKFHDLNANGVKEPDEPGLEGWTIFLDGNNNRTLNDGESAAVTNSLGAYSFSGLTPGVYAVTEVMQPGWEQTFPSVEIVSFSPSVFTGTSASEQQALNDSVGITPDFTIEDFEDTSLEPGLSVEVNGNPASTTIPFDAIDSGSHHFQTGTIWDGNTTLYALTDAAPLVFHFDDGASSVGVGLGDVENPLRLFVNGQDLGNVRDLPNYDRSSDNSREVYIRIDAGDEPIMTVEFEMNTAADRVFYDHLAFREFFPVGDMAVAHHVTLDAGETVDDVNFGNRQLPVVSIAGTTSGTETGPINGVFTVTQTAEAAADTVLTYSVGGSSTSGDDYTPLSGTVTIPAGSTSATITVPVIDDAIVEGVETLELTLTGITSSSAGVTIDSGANTDTININDDDTATVSVTADTPSAAEGGADGRFLITLSQASATDTVVNISASGTAERGSLNDYTLVVGSVTIPAGSTSVFKLVHPIDDSLVEGAETVILTVTEVISGRPEINVDSSNDSDVVTIADNDSAIVTLSAESKNEGTGTAPTTFTFSVDLSSPVDAIVSMMANTLDGTATSSNDFTSVSGQLVSFAAGDTTTQTVEVEVDADSDIEADEAFDLVMSGLTSGGLNVIFDGGGSTLNATATILNDDEPPRIIDDGDLGFSTTGSWPRVSNKPQVQDGDFLYNGGGTGQDNATWSFADVSAGQYRVSVSYRSFGNRASNAPFTIRDGAAFLTTVRVDQRQAAGSLVHDGIPFHDLGEFNILSGALSVELTDDADGLVVADAVRIERLGDVVPGPEIQVTVDGGVLSDNSGVVNFGDVEADRIVSKTFTVTNIGTTDLTLTDPITVPGGFLLTSAFGSNVLAPFASTTFEITVDTAVLGSQSGLVSFANDDVGGEEDPFNFTVEANVIPATGIQIIDNGDAGYSTTGNWNTISGNLKGHQNDFQYANSGTGTNTASWAFDVTPGQYQVAATWKTHSNRSTAAPYTVFNNTAPILTATADQSVAAAGIDDDGSSFAPLGIFNISSDRLVVTLTDNASGLVIADAIRIERIGDIPTGPEIGVIDSGTDIPDDIGVADFGDVEQGEVIVKTLTVFNFGTSDLTLTEPITTSPGFTTTGFGATTLAANESTTFDLEIDTSVLGPLSGTVSFGTNDSDENPFNFAVQGNVIPASTIQVIDNSESAPGFSQTGSWVQVNRNGHNGGFHFASGSATGGGTSTWSFDVADPGLYRVSATWRQHSNRASNARYSLNDDLSSSVYVDQRVAPNVNNGIVEAGSTFEDLGNFRILGNTLIVTLNNLADGLVIADAIRIERVGD